MTFEEVEKIATDAFWNSGSLLGWNPPQGRTNFGVIEKNGAIQLVWSTMIDPKRVIGDHTWINKDYVHNEQYIRQAAKSCGLQCVESLIHAYARPGIERMYGYGQFAKTAA